MLIISIDQTALYLDKSPQMVRVSITTTLGFLQPMGWYWHSTNYILLKDYPEFRRTILQAYLSPGQNIKVKFFETKKMRNVLLERGIL